MHVQTFAHERTPLTLMEKLRGGLRPIPVDMDQDGDVETSPGVCIGHNIVIAKTQRPDGVMPCMLRQLDLVDVMTFPIAKGIGVIFALDIEREEDHEVVFDTTIFHPNETSTVIFRKHMLKMNE
jgi:azurin